LLALLLIPILVVDTDSYTGEQTDYDFVWYIVAFTVLFCFLFRAFKEYKKYKEENTEGTEEEEAVTKKGEEEPAPHFAPHSAPHSEWTSEHVGHWIGKSELVRETSALTEGELLAIASKFVEAHVNGIVFPLVAYDTDALKRDVGLTVGEAVLFVHTMEKLSALVEGCTQSNSGDSQDLEQKYTQPYIKQKKLMQPQVLSNLTRTEQQWYRCRLISTSPKVS
jgi:hypothetical protein